MGAQRTNTLPTPAAGGLWGHNTPPQPLSLCPDLRCASQSEPLITLHPLFQEKEGKFLLFNYSSRAHCVSYHQLLDIMHMAVVTYFFRGNLLSPNRLLFLITSKGSFICTFPQTRKHIPQPLLDQLWTTGWNGK